MERAIEKDLLTPPFNFDSVSLRKSPQVPSMEDTFPVGKGWGHQM